ncbi:hypothetical protein ACHAWF_015449 [Thalassiosira exigua]
MIFANQGLVQWFSKKQATVETSVFGAEFVAMKNGMKCLRGIQYKLRMLDAPVDYTHCTSSGTTCQSSTTLGHPSQCSRRRAIRYAIMQSEWPWLWASALPVTSPPTATMRTCS